MGASESKHNRNTNGKAVDQIGCENSKHDDSAPGRRDNRSTASASGGVSTSGKSGIMHRAEWCQPMWVLDSWSYEVAVSKKKEEEARTKLSENDANDLLRLRRFETRGTSMILLREGAVLAAFCVRGPLACGVKDDNKVEEDEVEEDSRDVALAVVLAKMIAFLPFRGLRANSDAQDPMLLSSDYSYSLGDLRPGVPIFNTLLLQVWGTTPHIVEECASFRLPVGERRQVSTETYGSVCVASGALGNIAYLTQVLPMHLQPMDYFLTRFVKGAALSDNPTSIDMLLRFPPPGWEKAIANFFHLTTADSPVWTRSKRSPLFWIYCILREQLLPKNDEVLWAKKFLMENGRSEPVGRRDTSSSSLLDPEMPQHNQSAFHGRLLANILHKKEYPNCGGGYMAFPAQDIAPVVNHHRRRVPRTGSIHIGGVLYSHLALGKIIVELQPMESWTWANLTFPMKRHDIVELDLEPKHGGKLVLSKTQVATRQLEMKLDRLKQDPTSDESGAWNSLSLTMGPDTVHGVTYTKVECALQCLEASIRKKKRFSDSYCEWDTLACVLDPSIVTTPIGDTTHFTDESGRSFRNVDCIVVALAISPKRQPLLNWVHLGIALWKNAEDTVSIPVCAISLPEITRALTSAGKRIEEVLHNLLPEESKEVVGGGGKMAAVGPCSSAVKLTELECYLVAYTLDETKMLADAATEDPPEVVDRLIRILTPARISEKGRRSLEASMEGVGSFEKSYCC